ncbi:O-antigen ligase family protein [Brevundimonas bacteroides]|uniref:O-antigen ligase family protein n=1 Tax=Brevundimonas bacteroides TaxID=74311 RepID=UPI001FDFDAEB|nr:O-antigen ligase family protein [Brevundimonas bacteroides]
MSAPVAVALAATPILLVMAHLAFGANQPAAAQWLTAALGAALLIAVATPLRRDMGALDAALVPGGLFLATIGVALWTLTPFGPGGAHPAWTWAAVGADALTVDRSSTVMEIVKLMGLGSAFVIGALQGARRDRAEATLQATIWVGGAYAALSLVSFVSGLQIAQGGRLTGGFLSANSGATVFGMLTVLGLALFLRDWRRAEGRGFARRLTRTAVSIACTSLTATCLLLTASRLGMAATVGAVAVLLVWTFAREPKSRSAGLLAAGLFGVIGVVLLLGGNDLIWSRIGSTQVGLADRGALFATHWKAFIASPVFGWGLGTFDTVNLHLMTAETAPELWTIRATHNVYLQWLEEAGVVGTLPMVLTIAWVIGASLLRVGEGRGQGLLIGLVCMNLVVLVHGLADFALQVPSIAAFWSFLLGLQFAFARGRSR